MRVVIVGAGFGGLAAAIELREHGFTDVTLLDAAVGLGGTWRANTYPGAACDVASHLYSFSFAQRRDWSRLCSPQDEILAYMEEVARDRGVADLIQTGVRVTACRFEDDDATWTVEAQDGRSFRADVVLLATGQLHQPAYPRLPGLESFAGHAFHSAEWDHDHDLAGRRVAVVGTGASAVQLVPEVADAAAHLTVFQRTGNWFMPRKNRPYPAALKALIAHLPGLQTARRALFSQYVESLTLMIRHPRTLGLVGRAWSTLHMRRQLTDPEVRRRAWPDYTYGCKRILFSSRFLPTLCRPDVELVTEPITGIEPAGLRTADGRLHEVDTIVYGTGFKTTEFMFPMEVHGREGLSLRDAWADGPRAHLGLTVPGFPNLFIVYGPNTNTSGGSIVTYLEAQAGYVRQALEHLRDRGAVAVEVRPEVETAADAVVQSRFAGTAWVACDSWYRDDTGRIVTNWPGYVREYVAATRTFEPGEYAWARAPDRQPTTA